MIILQILKILGIVLLCLLGLILLLLLAVLFVPIRYSVEGSYPKTPYFKGRVSWLLHLIQVNADYDEGKDFTFGIRLAGIRILPRAKKNKKGNHDVTSTDEPKAEEEEKQPLSEQKEAEPSEQALSAERKEEKDQALPEKAESTGQEDKKRKKKSKQVEGQEEGSKADRIKAKFDKIWGILTDDGNQEAFSFVMGELKSLLAKIAPKRMKGYVNFGLGSPDYTGYVLGFVSVMPFVYDKKFHMNPDFECDDPYFDGCVKTGGKFRVIHVAVMAIHFLKNRQIRRLIKQVKK